MKIRKAQTLKDMKKVWSLTHDRYVAKGYARPASDGLLRNHASLEDMSETVVWIAENESGHLLGTISCTVDGPGGLPIDEVYQPFMDRLRNECLLTGKRLGACWRLVVDGGAISDQRVTRKLFMKGIAYGLDAGVGPALHIAHPSHAPFYERAFGFTKIAGPFFNPQRNSHSVLLKGELSAVLEQWQRIRVRRSGRMASVEV